MRFVQCRDWAMFLCNNMSKPAVIISLFIIGLIVAHILFRILNNFYLGKVVIYLLFIVMFSFNVLGFGLFIR